MAPRTDCRGLGTPPLWRQEGPGRGKVQTTHAAAHVVGAGLSPVVTSTGFLREVLVPELPGREDNDRYDLTSMSILTVRHGFLDSGRVDMERSTCRVDTARRLATDTIALAEQRGAPAPVRLRSSVPSFAASSDNRKRQVSTPGNNEITSAEAKHL